MINKEQLEASVGAAGAFIGLLQQDASGAYSVNTDFFNPQKEVLKDCGDRMNDLIDLLYVILEITKDSPPPASPPVFTDANWLMIQNPKTDGKSPFYVVVPAQSSGKTPDTGQIGIGALLPTTLTNLNFEVYIYIPLFNYSPTGTSFLLDEKTASFQIGVNISSSDVFKSGDVSFSGINISATICFDSITDPSFSLTFLGLTGATQAPVTTISQLLESNVLTWLGTTVLQNPTVTGWLNTNILAKIPTAPSITVGALLAAAQFITASPAPVVYSLNQTYLQTPPSPKEIALNFLFGMLDALSGQNLITLPGGGISITSRPDPSQSGFTQYGLRMTMEMPLNDGSGKESASPAVDLCLGAWLSGEDDDNNWMKRSGAPTGLTDGLMVWLISQNPTSKAVSFSPGFSLSSIGVNINGSAGKPLFSIDGYTLHGAELRATLDGDPLLTPAKWTFGFAAKLDQIGFPLVPPGSSAGAAAAAGDDTKNTVAQSLLQSKDGAGSGDGDTQGAGDKAPVNPTFGLAAAWYSGTGASFNLQLFDTKDQPSDQVIIPINRQLGPLACEQIGIGWVNTTHILSILFDGSVSLGPLTVSLHGLTVGIPVTAPGDLSEYTLDLQGMGITFSAGAVSLTGAFEKVPATTDRPYTEYDGLVAIKAGPFAISALGAYAYAPATPPQTGGFASLFILGVLDAPLGGPGFFFVTGVALGFGYNRAINLPDMNSVPDFPFMAMLKNPGAFGDPTKVTEILAKIDSFVPPERGEYWLAAGIRFTSFDLINSAALLTVEFGNELEIGILGDSWMSLPPPATPGGVPPTVEFVYVELGIDIQILPSQGVISVTAILTPNSFLLYQDCHLTGGFAFFVWFGPNPHAGQFVFTVGGYNPHFNAPTYFPQVPRLGFNWNVSTYVTISGDSYFTLTSSAIMAGGGLSVVFSFGIIKAWFIAQMDALVQWAPFLYYFDVSISIGVSLKLDLLFCTITITLELGASLSVYGPSLGGVAHISILFVSFSVTFGQPPPQTAVTIDWDGFSATLLPNKAPTKSGNQFLEAASLDRLGAATSASITVPAVLTITAVNGVIGYLGPNNEVWVVRPASFAFAALTAFPTTSLTVTPAEGETVTPWTASGYTSVDVRPMNVSVISSILNVELQSIDDSNAIYPLFTDFDFTTSTTNVEAAKWGSAITPQSNGMPGLPEMNSFLPGRLMGFQSITPKTTVLSPVGVNALNIDATIAFTNIVVDEGNEKHLPLSGTAIPVGTVPQEDGPQSWVTIGNALNDATVSKLRLQVFEMLIADFGINAGTNEGFENSDFAQEPGAYLNGYPLTLPVS